MSIKQVSKQSDTTHINMLLSFSKFNKCAGYIYLSQSLSQHGLIKSWPRIKKVVLIKTSKQILNLWELIIFS